VQLSKLEAQAEAARAAAADALGRVRAVEVDAAARIEAALAEQQQVCIARDGCGGTWGALSVVLCVRVCVKGVELLFFTKRQAALLPGQPACIMCACMCMFGCGLGCGCPLCAWGVSPILVLHDAAGNSPD
jgi:hypothetical protein